MLRWFLLAPQLVNPVQHVDGRLIGDAVAAERRGPPGAFICRTDAGLPQMAQSPLI